MTARPLSASRYVQLFSGLRCEREWGTPTTAFVYFTSGVGGCLASAAASQSSVGVGASGAIVGLVAARAGRLAAEWGARDPARRRSDAMQALTFLLMLAAVGAPTAAASSGGRGAATDGLLPSVDNYAHGGGLVVGLLVAVALWGSDPARCACALPTACLGGSGGGAGWGGAVWGAVPAWEGGGNGGGGGGGARAWLGGLNRLQRSALAGLVLYFGALSMALAASSVADRVISC